MSVFDPLERPCLLASSATQATHTKNSEITSIATNFNGNTPLKHSTIWCPRKGPGRVVSRNDRFGCRNGAEGMHHSSASYQSFPIL
eukprot:scaffold16801_cov73-Skeletonema_marinoi.AAC.4